MTRILTIYENRAEEDGLIDYDVSPEDLIDKQEEEEELKKSLKPMILFALISGINLARLQNGEGELSDDDITNNRPDILLYAEEATIKNSSRITNTDLKRIGVILDQVDTGKISTKKELNSAIRKVYKNNDIHRSRLAARYITTNSMGYATNLEFKFMGVELKSWRATLDGVARDTHVAAHFEYMDNPIPVDQYFSIGGYPALYPADFSLPPEESMNCRCAEIIGSLNNTRADQAVYRFYRHHTTIENKIRHRLRLHWRAQLARINSRLPN